MEEITKDDLEAFRVRLLEDFARILRPFMKEIPKEQWIKSREVKKILPISNGTLQNLRLGKFLNPTKINGCWYYDRKEVEGLLRKPEVMK